MYERGGAGNENSLFVKAISCFITYSKTDTITFSKGLLITNRELINYSDNNNTEMPIFRFQL